MKLAISGKGGVGKTTVAGMLARLFAAKGYDVIAIDADPDANLASALGLGDPAGIVPISEMRDLIEERTGAKPGSFGGYFKMNPTVQDLPEKLSLKKDGIRLMVMGTVKRGGGGCVCPESVLLKALVTNLVLYRKEVVLMDMEAGLEHLGRATTAAVDKLIVVVEPGRRSIDTAAHIRELAAGIGLAKIGIVGNKVRGEKDVAYLKEHLADFELLGFVPYDDTIVEADLANAAPFARPEEFPAGLIQVFDRLTAGIPAA
jgi:CO dehydrogenase maturation factor